MLFLVTLDSDDIRSSIFRGVNLLKSESRIIWSLSRVFRAAPIPVGAIIELVRA